MRAKEIIVDRFEFSTASDGDVMLSFIGPHRLPDMAMATIEGQDVVLRRDSGLPLRFVGLTTRDLQRLSDAPRVYVNRSFTYGDDYLTEARLSR